MPLLFSQCLWCLLTDCSSLQHVVWSLSLLHLTLISLPHYRVKCEQVQFCENSHCSTCFYKKKDVIVVIFLFWLILTTVHFVRNDINFMPSITYLKLFVSQLRLIFTPFLRCLFTDRTPQSGASRYLNLLTGQKSAFSPRRGDSLHRFT